MTTQRCRRRKGMTLLEVIIALTIFLFSMVALSHLVSMGSDRARDVQLQAHASMLCQSKLAEVIIGSEPLASTGLSTFPEDDAPPNSPFANFQYRIDANASEVANLWNVTVIVQRDRGDGTLVEARLSQMVLDPAVRGSSLSSGSSSALSSGSSSSSSSSSGSGSSPSTSTGSK